MTITLEEALLILEDWQQRRCELSLGLMCSWGNDQCLYMSTAYRLSRVDRVHKQLQFQLGEDHGAVFGFSESAIEFEDEEIIYVGSESKTIPAKVLVFNTPNGMVINMKKIREE